MTIHTKDLLRYAQVLVSTHDVQSQHKNGGGDAHLKAGNSKTIFTGEPSGSSGLPPLLSQSPHRDSSKLEPGGLCGGEAERWVGERAPQAGHERPQPR